MLRGVVALGVMSQGAVAQTGITGVTGGSPGHLPDISGVSRTAPATAAVAATQADATQALVLEIVVNGTSLGEPLTFDMRNGELYAEPQTLKAAGIRVDDLKPGADGWIALSSIPGLRATYVASRQQAVLDVTDARQIARQIGYNVPSIPKATPGTGFVLNYDTTYTHASGETNGNQFGVWSEQRLFAPFGVFDNTGTYVNGDGENRYTRLDSNFTYSNPEHLFSVTAGDTISGSLPWTRSVRYGGLQFQRDFTLRPDLVTFPLPTFAGSAAVPSTVDLYINGLRQYSGAVAPGPFQIAQAPALTGAGMAQVVTTDALGRRVTTSVPLYVDTRLLAKGLSNYSVDIGFLRDNYTIDSASYERSPVYNGSLSYGISDRLTVQAHAEGGQGLANGGAGALVGVGNDGVVNAASAASRVDGMTGALFSLGYQYISSRFSFTLQATRATNGYRDVAALTGTSIFRHIYQATASVALLRNQSATVSYIDSDDTFSGHARVVTLAYNAQIGKRWSLFATTYRDFLQKDVWGGSIGLTLALMDNVSVSKTLSQSGDHTTMDLSASRPADFNGGWGWSAQAGAGADYRHAFAGTDYRASFGDFQATAQRFNGTTTVTAEAAGALAFMDGALLPSRTITDGFALVSTDGVQKVPVMQENRPVGVTNSRGYLLVPDLTSYQRNQIAIDPLALPADAQIDTTKLDVAPARRSGVLAHFGMSRYQGASVSFVDAKGQPVPAGAAATNESTGETAIVGYDGIAFFRQLHAVNRVAIVGHSTDCTAEVPFTPSSSHDLPQIGPFVCKSGG